MPKCPGMGDIIADPVNNPVADEVLTFIMVNDICPAELARFIEIFGAYKDLSPEAKALIDSLVAEMNIETTTFSLGKNFRRPKKPLAEPPVKPIGLGKKASVKRKIK